MSRADTEARLASDRAIMRFLGLTPRELPALSEHDLAGALYRSSVFLREKACLWSQQAAISNEIANLKTACPRRRAGQRDRRIAGLWKEYTGLQYRLRDEFFEENERPGYIAVRKRA